MSGFADLCYLKQVEDHGCLTDGTAGGLENLQQFGSQIRTQNLTDFHAELARIVMNAYAHGRIQVVMRGVRGWLHGIPAAILDSMDESALLELVRERDELKEHAFRLQSEAEEARARVGALIGQRNALEAERDELKAHLTRLGAEQEMLFVPAGHFYSPVVDPKSPFVTRALASPVPLAAVEIDDKRMHAEFETLVRWYREMPFPAEKSEGMRYYFANPAFSWTDAFVLYGYIRTLRPKRIVEVGCGYSTCVIFDTIDRFADPRPEVSCFDPYPDVALQLTSPGDPMRAAIQAIPLQDIPDHVFSSLEAGDILFIDSSHIGKTGSDVLDYLFRALPLVKPGVYVHIHDIGYPFEYSEEWVVSENRSWNEGYFLRAFLMYNQAFEVVFWNSYFVVKFSETVLEKAPGCLNNGGGSIWLVRR